MNLHWNTASTGKLSRHICTLRHLHTQSPVPGPASQISMQIENVAKTLKGEAHNSAMQLSTRQRMKARKNEGVLVRSQARVSGCR